jgi:kynurenine formamidase
MAEGHDMNETSPPRDVPPEETVHGWMRELSNWGRWGDDDQRGTLNHIDDATRAAAARLVRTGRTVSLAWDIDNTSGSFGAPQRYMLSTGEGMADPARVASPAARGRTRAALEYIGLVFHGVSVTHLDALSHIMWDGQMYGGRPAELVNAWHGAGACDVLGAADGIVTRGVLLDVADCRGDEWIEPGQGIFPEDLEAAEERQGVRVGRGDALLLRTGNALRIRREGSTAGGARAGFHAACLPWLHEREVALIGADTAQEMIPSGYAEMPNPVHIVGIVAMGLWLLDNCDLEALAEACRRLGRFEFCFLLSPLRLQGVTGSPVNPLALL